MSKLKRLPASFRDVPFWVEATTDEMGALAVKHEYPDRREAYAEFGTGEHTPLVTVEAHFVGPNYLKELEDFRAALRVQSPGKLILPATPTMFVALESAARVSWSTREGGMARISVSFFEAGQAPTSAPTLDSGAQLAQHLPIVYLHVGESPFDVSGPDFLSEAALAILSGPKGVTAELQRVRARVSAAFNIVDETSSTIKEFGNAVGALVRTPETLAIKLQGLLNSIFTAITAAGFDLNRGDKQRNIARAAATLSYVRTLGKFGDSLRPVRGETTSRKKERANQATLTDWVEVMALTEGVRVFSDIPLDNSAQAGAALDDFLEIFDRIEDRGTVSDALAQALADMKASFVALLRETTDALVELGTFTPQVTMPALVIAYRLYGDASRDEEIVERNGVEHPGFVPGGVELMVSSA